MDQYKPVLLNQGSAVCSPTDVQLIGPRNTRKMVIISAPAQGMITISFNGPAVLGAGLNLFSGSNPLYLTADHFGDAIRGDIHCIASQANTVVGWIDTFV